jgi:hypothetical protein
MRRANLLKIKVTQTAQVLEEDQKSCLEIIYCNIVFIALVKYFEILKREDSRNERREAQPLFWACLYFVLCAETLFTSILIKANSAHRQGAIKIERQPPLAELPFVSRQGIDIQPHHRDMSPCTSQMEPHRTCIPDVGRTRQQCHLEWSLHTRNSLVGPLTSSSCASF